MVNEVKSIEARKESLINLGKEKGYVTYADLPNWVRLRAIDLMYYPEDVKLLIHEK